MGIVVYEGLDRAGKTTQIRQLAREPRGRPTVFMHFMAPPRQPDGAAMILSELEHAFMLAEENPGIDFVLDRGQVSVFAYGQLYRGLDHPRNALARWEAHQALTVPREIRVVDQPARVLYARDDGESTYTRPTMDETVAAITREQAVFARFIDESTWPVRVVNPLEKAVPA